MFENIYAEEITLETYALRMLPVHFTLNGKERFQTGKMVKDFKISILNLPYSQVNSVINKKIYNKHLNVAI